MVRSDSSDASSSSDASYDASSNDACSVIQPLHDACSELGVELNELCVSLGALDRSLFHFICDVLLAGTDVDPEVTLARGCLAKKVAMGHLPLRSSQFVRALIHTKERIIHMSHNMGS